MRAGPQQSPSRGPLIVDPARGFPYSPDRFARSVARRCHGCRHPGEWGPDAALAALRAAAANAGVGLTPHRAVVRRALATVEMVNGRITELQRTGGLRDVNAEFKAARAAGKGARYRDFPHAK
jgi:hypothetical protein